MSAEGLYLIYKPPVVDYMPEAAEVMAGARSACTVEDMLELAGGGLAPRPELRRPGLAEMQRIRAMALDYLARLLQAVVGPAGRVLVVDGAYESLQAAVDEAGGFGRVRLLLGSAMSASFPELLRVFRIFAGRGVPCIGGGIHLTARPGDLDRYLRPFLPAGAAQVAAVAGPCDLPVMRELVGDALSGMLRARYQGGQNVEPDYWRRLPWLGRGRHQMRCLEVSRGCPHSCSFCSISVVPREQRRLAVREIEDVLAEVRDTWGADAPGQRRLRFFVAENICAQKAVFTDLLERLVRECPGINFVAQADALVALDRPFLRLLRRAGCVNLLVGFESLREDNLEAIGKRSAFALKRRTGQAGVREAYAEAIGRIQDQGLTVMGAFILGLPHDRPGCGRELGEYMARHRLLPHPTALTALPGAELFESSGREQLLYGHPDDQPAAAGPYPAAFSGMDLTESNLAVAGGLAPAEIQMELAAVLEAVRGRAAPAALASAWSALRTSRLKGLAALAADPLAAAALVVSFHRGAARLERRINRGTAARKGAIARLGRLGSPLKKTSPSPLPQGERGGNRNAVFQRAANASCSRGGA